MIPGNLRDYSYCPRRDDLKAEEFVGIDFGHVENVNLRTQGRQMFGSIVAPSGQANPRSWRRLALPAPVREAPLVRARESIRNHIGG